LGCALFGLVIERTPRCDDVIVTETRYVIEDGENEICLAALLRKRGKIRVEDGCVAGAGDHRLITRGKSPDPQKLRSTGIKFMLLENHHRNNVRHRPDAGGSPFLVCQLIDLVRSFASN